MKTLALSLFLCFTVTNVNASDMIMGSSVTDHNNIIQGGILKVLHDDLNCTELLIKIIKSSTPSIIVLDVDRNIIETNEPFKEVWAVDGCKIEKTYMIMLEPKDKDHSDVTIDEVESIKPSFRDI